MKKMNREEIMNSIKIDYESMSIEITNRLSKEAARVSSEAYRILKEYRNDFPDFQVVVSKRKINSRKIGAERKISYKQMKDFIIRCHESDLAKFEEMTAKKYDTLNDRYVSVNSYFTVKKWFIKKYGVELGFKEENPVAKNKSNDSVADKPTNEANTAVAAISEAA